MNSIAERMGKKLASALHYDEEQQAVITYGLLAVIQFLIVVVLIVALGAIFGTILESLVLCFSVSVLRRNAGGAHVSSIGLCSILGVIISVVMPTLFDLSKVQAIGAFPMHIVSSAVLLAALVAVVLKAPVESPNKPIKSMQKRKRLKRNSIIAVLLYFIICNLLIVFNKNTFAFCILFGVSWQAFTMLPIGHAFLNFIDMRLHRSEQ